MKLSMLFEGGVVALPEKTVDILRGASATELKLLIYISSDKNIRNEFSCEDAAIALSSSADEINNALKYLCSCGLVSCEDAKNPEISVRTKKAGGRSITVVKSGKNVPSYTGAEIEEIFAQNSHIGALIDDCQRILGKMMTLIEINKIIALLDLYRLDGEYVTMLCEYAVRMGKPSVPYIDKMAHELYEQGVTTHEALGERLEHLEKIATLEGFVRRLFGLGERKLTAKEGKFVEQWLEYGYSNDMIELAYEITVDNGKGTSMPYMNKILTNWRDAGHTTTEAVIASIEKYRQVKNTSLPLGSTASGYTSAAEEAILSNSRNRARKKLSSNEDNNP